MLPDEKTQVNDHGRSRNERQVDPSAAAEARGIGYAAGVRLDTMFLDAGGVLMNPNFARVSEALARHGVEVPAARLSAAEPHAKHALDVERTILATRDDQRGQLYFHEVLARAGVTLSPQTDAALSEMRAYQRTHNLWESVPAEVPGALAALRALGLRLVVVSNANGTLDAHFARLGLTPLVDLVLDSEVEGVEKPDPRLFRIALERSGASPDSTVHVGDFYHVDVVGARAAGLRAVLLDVAGLYEGADCPRVRSLAELVARTAAGEFGDTPRRSA